MRALRSVLCALLLVMVAAAHAASADETDELPTTPAELKAMLQKMIQSSWDLESYRGWWLRDGRGKTPYDDLRAFVLFDADLTALRTLIIDADQQSARDDQGALRATMQKANAVLMRELANASLVFWYWGDAACNAYHRQLIERLWLQLEPTQAASAKEALSAAEQPLLAQEASILNTAKPNLFAVSNVANEQLRKVQQQLAEIYGRERLRLAKEVSDLNRERGIAPLGRDRRSACTPAQQTSHKPQPQLVQPVPKPEYPSYARRVGLAGPVTVHMWISELGCLDRVEVWRSSGAPELDDATLDWAENDAVYLPAEVNGKAVPSDRSFTMNFDLKE